MDKLEKFINENRSQLDKYEPGEEVWKKIRKKNAHSRLFTRRFLSAAAVVIVLVASSVLLVSKPGRAGDVWEDKSSSLSLKKDYRETEDYYNNRIEQLYRKAQPVLTSNPELATMLSIDMAHLDSLCLQVKNDLNDNIGNREPIEALIVNYRIKVRILEEMLIYVDNEQSEQSGKKSDNEI